MLTKEEFTERTRPKMYNPNPSRRKSKEEFIASINSKDSPQINGQDAAALRAIAATKSVSEMETAQPVSKLEKIDRAYAAKHPDTSGMPLKKTEDEGPVFGFKQVKEQTEKIGVPSQMSDEQLERAVSGVINTDYVTPAQVELAKFDEKTATGAHGNNINPNDNLSVYEIAEERKKLASKVDEAKEKQKDIEQSEAYLKGLYEKRTSDKIKGMTDEELDAEIEAVGNPNPLTDIFSSDGDVYITDTKSTAPKAEKYQREVIDIYQGLSKEDKELVMQGGYGAEAARGQGGHVAMAKGMENKATRRLRELGYSDDSIEKLLDYGYILYNEQKNEKFREGIENLDNVALTAANVASIPANLTSGVGQADITLQTWRNRYTDNYKPVDYNTKWSTPGQLSRKVRSETSDRIDNFALNLIYNTGMSIADSAFAMALTGKLSPYFLSGSAGLNAIYDAKERGASDYEAVNFGIMSAVSEALFEKVSVDRLFKAKDIKGTKDFWVNVLKQMFTEGTEEVNTSVFNTIADAIIMGDKSEINTNITKYMTDGKYSREKAEKLAWRDYIASLGLDFLGGFISGGVFGFGDSAVRGLEYRSRRITHNMTEEERAAYEQAMRDYNADLYSPEGKKLFEAAYKAAGDPALATKEGLGKYEADKIKTISDVLIKAGESERSARTRAALISKAFEGEALTNREARSIAQNSAALTAFNEFIGSNIKFTNFSETANAIRNTIAEKNQARENRRKNEIDPKMRTIVGRATFNEKTGEPEGEISNGLRTYLLYQIPEVFIGDAVTLYDAGIAGMSLEKAESLFKSSRMPAYMKQAMWKAGKDDAKARRSATAHKTVANPEAKFVDNEFSVNISVDVKNQLEAIAHALGRNVRFGSLYGKGAEYDRKTGDIIINVKSKNPVRDLLLHEATHDFAVQDPEGFKKYQSYVIKTKLKNGTLNAEIEEIEKKYDKQGKSISRAELLEEIAANHTREMQADIELFEKFYAEMPNVAQRFLNAIKRFIEKIKRAFGKSDSASELERAAELWEASLYRIRRNVDKQRAHSEKQAAKAEKKAAEMDNTVIDARINKNDDLDIGETDTEVDALGIYPEESGSDEATPYEEDPVQEYGNGEDSGDGDGDIAFSIEHTTDNRRVVVIEDNILDGVNPDDYVKVTKQAISKFKPAIPVGGRLIKVNRTTAKEYTNSKYSKKQRRNNKTVYIDKLNTAGSLDEIVLASTNYVNEDLNHQRDDNIKEFARGSVLIKIGIKKYSASVIVGYTNSGEMLLYDLIDMEPVNFAIKKESVPNRPSNSAKNSAADREEPLSNNRIPQNQSAVNSNNMQSEQSYYDNDVAAEASARDAAFFIEDIVEDEDGNIHENVVVVDTDIFKNKKPRNFKEALIDYVYNNLAGKPFLAKDNYGNDVTIEFAKINERVQKDGASRAHRAIDKLARKNDRNSQLAVAQARELIYVSKESGGNSEHKHQWLDENGWKFRTAKMQLPSGEIYEVTLNIGRARDGRNILYDINKIKNIGRATLPESGNKSGSGSHTNSDVSKSIPQNEAVVNSGDKMSFIEDVEGDEGYVTSAELEANAKKHINARSSNEISDMGIRKMARETKIPEADLQNLRRIYRRCRVNKGDSEEFNRLIFIARGLATTSLMRYSGSDHTHYNGVSGRIVDTVANELIAMIAEDTYTTPDDLKAELKREYKANLDYITASERARTDKAIEMMSKISSSAERKLTNYINSKTREELLKVTKRLLEGKRIPPNVKEQVRSRLAALGFEKLDLERVNFDSGKRESLRVLKSIYEQLQSENEGYADERIESIINSLGYKHLDEMKIGDVKKLLDVFKSFEHELRTGRRMLNAKETRELSAIASAEVARIDRAPRIDAVSKRGRLRNGYVGLFLTPENLIKRATGFDGDSELLKYFRLLNDGQRKMLAYINEGDAFFADFINDKDFVKKLMSRKIEVVPGVYVTPNQLISLGLHSECEDNLRHIREKGVRIPKFENYIKGRSETQGSRIVRLDKESIDQLVEKLTPREKAYMSKIREYFNTKQKNAINETSLLLRGYEEATVENYFPIYTDKNFLAQNYVDISQDGLPTFRWWSLNERKEDANAVMMLMGATEVVDRSIKSTARYWGMAIPMRDFKALYNASVVTYNEEGIETMKKQAGFDGIQDYNNRRTIEKSIFRRNIKNISSIKESITQRFGQTANTQIQDILKDLSASKVVFDATGFLNKLRGGYAASVLSLNLSSFFVQLSGIASGGSVLGVRNVIRAYSMSKRFDDKKLAEIEKYTPLLKTRMRGFTTQELGSVTTGLGRSILSSTYRTAMESKWLDWMTNVDVWTIKGLWNAAELKASQENPGLKSTNRDAYMKKVAELFNEAVEKTQPNSTPLQRPRVMRLKGAWSFLTMFKSQAYATLNVSYEAWAEYRAAQGRAKVSTPAGNVGAIQRNKAILSAARKKFISTALTCLLQALISEAARFVGKMLMHDDKAYKDDEGKITVGSVLGEIGSGAFGSVLEPFPFIGNIYNVVESYAKYGPSTLADYLSETHTAMVNDVIVSLFNVVDVVGKDNKTGADVSEAVYQSFVAIGSLCGIPVNNARKLIHGAAKWVNEMREGGGYLADYTELVYTNDLYDKKNGKIVISDKAVEVAANAYINDYDAYSAILDDIYASKADYKNAVTRITNKAKKKIDSSK